MRRVSQPEWDDLYTRARQGNPHALVTLKTMAISRVACSRGAQVSRVPPWLREDLAEEAFDLTEPRFRTLTTWARAFAFMTKTMERLVIKTRPRGHEVLLEDAAHELVDERSEHRVLEVDFQDFLVTQALRLTDQRYQQYRALVQACWMEPESRDELSRGRGSPPGPGPRAEGISFGSFVSCFLLGSSNNLQKLSRFFAHDPPRNASR